MTDAIDAARTAWQRAKADLDAHPSYWAMMARSAAGPPEQWYVDLAELELRELEARHALERAEEDAEPEPPAVSRAAARQAIGAAIDSAFALNTIREALHAELTAALDLYGSAAELTWSERLRAEYLVVHKGIRAALAGEPEARLTEASEKLAGRIAMAFEHPAALPDTREMIADLKPSKDDTPVCAFRMCRRGPGGRPALLRKTPAGKPRKFCCAGCREAAYRARKKEEAGR